MQLAKQKMQKTILPVVIILLIHHFTGGVVIGILNRQSGSCQQDDDCSSKQTFLYCINKQCQCLRGGSSYVHGVLLQFNMEWDPYQSKCVSKPGSPCTFKNRWYSASETAKLDCSQESTCIPHAASSGSREYQQQHAYQQQQSRYQQQDYAMTPSDFGICWQNRQGQGGESVVGSNAGSQQTPFYPVLTPNNPQPYQPERHEFASHGNPYPISPTKLGNNGACGKYAVNTGLFLFSIMMIPPCLRLVMMS